jgi:hypothetical protein
MFPADEQSQARGALAACLRGVIAQRLLKRADGTGRVVAVEILLGTNAVSALIREKKVYQLPSVIQTSRREGMQLLDDALLQLTRAGIVTAEEARRFAAPKFGTAAAGETQAAPPSESARPEGARPSGAPMGAGKPSTASASIPRPIGTPASPGK